MCLRYECSAMGGTDRCVYTKNVASWEAQTGVFTLECSAMGAPDRCVYAKNVVPWEAQTGMFTLRM